MIQLEINDNTRYDRGAFSDVPNITRVVADKKLGQLEREGVFIFPDIVRSVEDIDENQVVLSSEGDNYCAGNVMGFLGSGDERLTIKSRFSGEGEDYFLQYLLGEVVDAPNFVKMESDADPSAHILNIAVFLFPYFLKAAMRKGPFKKYDRFAYNDEHIKGSIDIARHISRNTPFCGKVAYSRRELSYDNYLMELIRHTVEFIKNRPFGADVLFRVKDEVKIVVAATPKYEQLNRRKVISDNVKHPIQHAFYREYLALQRLCIQILRHQRHLVGSGPHKIYGFLFDGAWLWEEYVYSLIGASFFHPRNKARKGKQYLFGGGAGPIFPDFLSKDCNNRVIADAKYKPIGNIGNGDYFQVLAYMMRFDAKSGYFLYPEAEGATDKVLRLNKGSTFENNVVPRDDVRLIKHGLPIPMNAGDYESFAFEMKRNERAFLEAFPGASS